MPKNRPSIIPVQTPPSKRTLREELVIIGERTARSVANSAGIYISYGTIIMGEWLVFSLLWWTLREDITKYALVATIVDVIRIGLAIMTALGGFVHSVVGLIVELS